MPVRGATQSAAILSTREVLEDGSANVKRQRASSDWEGGLHIKRPSVQDLVPSNGEEAKCSSSPKNPQTNKRKQLNILNNCSFISLKGPMCKILVNL